MEPVAIPHTEPEDEGTDGGDSRTNTEGHDKYVPRSGHEDYNNYLFESRQFVRETLRITIPPLPIPKGWSRADKGKNRAPRETGKGKKVSTTQFRKPL